MSNRTLNNASTNILFVPQRLTDRRALFVGVKAASALPPRSG
jgi:hypothetical protein